MEINGFMRSLVALDRSMTKYIWNQWNQWNQLELVGHRKKSSKRYNIIGKDKYSTKTKPSKENH
jgi:hypothetical protein